MKRFGTAVGGRGFSLIEMLVYLAVIAVMLAVIVTTLTSFSGAYHSFVLDRRIHAAAGAALERMVREVRGGTSIDVATSTLGAHPGTLTINTVNDTGDPVTRTFAVNAGVLELSEDGVLRGPLTSSNVAITNLVFRHLDNGVSEGVRIELTVQASRKSTVREANFYAFTVLRGSLE